MRDAYVVVMWGFTGVGKSTLAKAIAPALGAEIFHSSVVRNELQLMPSKEESMSFFDITNTEFTKKMGDKVYGEMVKRAREALQKGIPVILDGGAHYTWQRQRYYDLAHEFDVPVCVLKVVCEDEEEIKRRLEERKDRWMQGDNPLDEAPAWKTYVSTRDHAEPPEKDTLANGKKPNIIEYDSQTKSFKNIQGEESCVKKIMQALEGKK